jgi:hypothetical protein
MGFRFRIGPCTFGRTGIRFSLWRFGTGISAPLFGKSRSFGKIGFGPLSWHFGGSRRAKDVWRNDPATDRQKRFADELGIKYPENVTKGELSDLISQAMQQK